MAIPYEKVAWDLMRTVQFGMPRHLPLVIKCRLYWIDELLMLGVLCLPVLDISNGAFKYAGLPAIAQPLKSILILVMLARVSQLSLAWGAICLAYIFSFFLSAAVTEAFSQGSGYFVVDLANAIKNASLIIAYSYFEILIKKYPGEVISKRIFQFFRLTMIICFGNILIGATGLGHPQYTFWLPNGKIINVGTVGYYFDGNTLAALLIFSAIPFAISAHKKGNSAYLLALVFLISLSVFKATKAGILGIVSIGVLVPLLHLSFIRLRVSIVKAAAAALMVVAVIGIAPMVVANALKSNQGVRLASMANRVNFASFIFSGRNDFLQKYLVAYEDYSPRELILGRGYKSTEVAGWKDYQNKTIEIDCFDIVFQFGLLGLVLSYGLWIYLIIRSCCRFIGDRGFSPYVGALISNLIFFGLSFFSGHIVGSGVLGFYFAAINSIRKPTSVKLEGPM